MVNVAVGLDHLLRADGSPWLNPMGRGLAYGVTLVLLGFAALMNAIIIGPYFVDDAYITLHNAQVLLHGTDPNYEHGSALSGATCAPHVVLVALLSLFFDGPWAVWTASLLGAVAFACGLVRLCEVTRLSPISTIGIVIGGLTIANTPYQLLNGLETSWAMAAITWTLVFISTAGKRAKLGTAVLCGTLPFLRPELVACSALIAIGPTLALAKKSKPQRLEVLREGIVLCLVALLAALPWLLLYTAQTGSPVPSTIAAKSAYFAEGCAPTEWKLDTFANIFQRFVGDAGPWPLALLALPLVRTGKALLGFVFVFVGAYFVRFPGALGHYAQRYLYVFMPLMILGAVTLVRHQSNRLRAVGNTLLTLGLFYNVWHAPEAVSVNQSVAQLARRELTIMAATARERIPPKAVVLVHDAGFISYATNFRLVDLVGLKTPESVIWHQHLTLPTCGMHRGHAVHEIALHSGANYFIVLRGWDKIYGLTAALTTFGWTLEPLAERSTGYDLYQLTQPTLAATIN